MTEKRLPKFNIGDIVWFVDDSDDGNDAYKLRYIKIELIVTEKKKVTYCGKAFIYENSVCVNDEDIFHNVEAILRDVAAHIESREEESQKLDGEQHCEQSHKTKLEAEARAQGKSE